MREQGALVIAALFFLCGAHGHAGNPVKNDVGQIGVDAFSHLLGEIGGVLRAVAEFKAVDALPNGTLIVKRRCDRLIGSFRILAAAILQALPTEQANRRFDAGDVFRAGFTECFPRGQHRPAANASGWVEDGEQPAEPFFMFHRDPLLLKRRAVRKNGAFFYHFPPCDAPLPCCQPGLFWIWHG